MIRVPCNKTSRGESSSELAGFAFHSTLHLLLEPFLQLVGTRRLKCQQFVKRFLRLVAATEIEKATDFQ